MFDSSFAFNLIQKRPLTDCDFIAEYVYQFRTNARRYIATVEEYRLNIFVVKFFPADKKNDPNRFQIVLNDFEFPSILRTCLNVMLEFLAKNPFASFGYLGANSVSKNFEESKFETQRFRIYEYAINIFFDPKNFVRLIGGKVVYYY